MWWLWILAPFAAGLLFVLTGQVDRRALKEIEDWRAALGARRAGGAKKKAPKGEKKKKGKNLGPKKLSSAPLDLLGVAEQVGAGRPLGDFELVPGVAYATFVMGDLAGSSDHQTVLVRLSDQAPMFTARPNAFFEGKPLPPTAIEFRKDPAFAKAYLVEASEPHKLAKDVGKWLTRALRELLIDSGDVWLRASRKTLALTIYGPVRKDKIDKLLEIADVFVAEYGDEGGPSLFGEDEDERAARLAEAEEALGLDDEEEAQVDEKKAEEDDADDEDDDDDEDDVDAKKSEDEDDEDDVKQDAVKRGGK